MHNSNSSTIDTKRGYTPQLSNQAIFILRRLAWSKGAPMTKTLDALVLAAAGGSFNPATCSTCPGGPDKCPGCMFKSIGQD